MPIFDDSSHYDLRGCIWFDADKWELIIGDLDCDHHQDVYDLYEDIELITAIFHLPISGQMDCDHTNGIYAQYEDIELFTGTTPTVPITGDIDCTFESYPVDIEVFTGTTAVDNITGDVDCTGQEPVCIMQAGLHMALTAAPWEFASYSNVEGEDMDNMVFKEFKFEAYAQVDFVTLKLDTLRFGLRMNDAPDFHMEFEDFIFEGAGTAGFTGGIDATGRRFELAMTGGPLPTMEAAFEEMAFEATGSVPNSAGLVLTSRQFSGTMEALTGNVSALNLRGRQMSFSGTAQVEILASLNVSSRQMWFDAEGFPGKVADVDTLFRSLLFWANASLDGDNDLDLTLPGPDVEMGSGGVQSGETCATAEDLTFEETL